MSDQVKDILSKALKLPPIERAELIESLLASFEVSSNKEVYKRWAKEAEERIDAYESGKLSAKPAREVFDAINKDSLHEG